MNYVNRNRTPNEGAAHTSKSAKKRVSSCPELCRHRPGQWAGTLSISQKILTTSQSQQGVARRRWRLANTNPIEFSIEPEETEVGTPYDRTAHADANRKLHFVLHSHPY